VRQRIDLTGERFGSWTVLSYDSTRNRATYWLCLCGDCGATKAVASQHLRYGHTSRCSACVTAARTINDRSCRWCGRPGFARRGVDHKRVGLSVTAGECEACRTQARRVGRDVEGRPLSNGQRKVAT